MRVGLIGLPQSGKTTIFNALTNLDFDVKGYAQEKIESHIGVVKVPDRRIEHLVSTFNPKKTSYAEMTFIDIGGKKGLDGHAEFDLKAIREVDMLAVIIRAFKSDDVLHPLGGVDLLCDISYLESEFLIADLLLIETRLERIEKEIKRNKKENLKEFEYLQQFKEHLDNEQPLSSLEINDEAEMLFRGFQFLTMKPVLFVLNTGEDETDTADTSEVVAKFDKTEFSVMILSGKLEMEIAQLNDEDKAVFLEDMGMDEPVLNRFIKKSYSLLDRIVFFTVGPDEVKAWEIPSGISAKQAAGKIHTDISRGFIRAEVLGFQDYVECDNSYPNARSKGLVRLEGKEYKVKDGDMIEFRFNV